MPSLESLFADSYGSTARQDYGLTGLLKDYLDRLRQAPTSTVERERGLTGLLRPSTQQVAAAQAIAPQADAEVLAGYPVPPPASLGGMLLDLGLAAAPPSEEGVLLATPAWRKRGGAGVIAQLQNLIRQGEIKPTTALHEKIASRDEVYHATDLEGFRGILDAGEIRSNPWLHQGLGVSKQKQLIKKGKPQWNIEEGSYWDGKNWGVKDPDGNLAYITSDSSDHAIFHTKAEAQKWVKQNPLDAGNPLAGVSVSRVPRISPKAEKAISFVIDRSKMPRSRPLAEEGYRKTFREQGYGDWMKGATAEEIAKYNDLAAAYNKASTSAEQLTTSKAFQKYANALKAKYKSQPLTKMNSRFEYEDRTYGEPIPLAAVKEVLVDMSALPPLRVTGKFADQVAQGMFGKPDQTYLSHQDWLKINNTPVEQLARDYGADNSLESIFSRAFQAGLPVRVFPSGPAMHTKRVHEGGVRKPERLSYGAHSGSKKGVNPNPFGDTTPMVEGFDPSTLSKLKQAHGVEAKPTIKTSSSLFEWVDESNGDAFVLKAGDNSKIANDALVMKTKWTTTGEPVPEGKPWAATVDFGEKFANHPTELGHFATKEEAAEAVEEWYKKAYGMTQAAPDSFINNGPTVAGFHKWLNDTAISKGQFPYKLDEAQEIWDYADSPKHPQEWGKLLEEYFGTYKLPKPF